MLILIFIFILFLFSIYVDYGYLFNVTPSKKSISLNSKYIIRTKVFITYKLINTMFLGIAIGSYVTQYKPIKIEDFPVMGIAFSLLAIPVALLYKRIMTVDYFFKILLLVELIMFIWMVFFLINPYSYHIALLIYIARNITFLFGDFLGRAETLFLKKTDILSYIDMLKQVGSIIGMILSVLFYKWLETSYLIYDNQTKVYYIHFLLLFLQVIIILLVLRSFKKVS